MAKDERMQGIETRLLMRYRGWLLVLALAVLAALLPMAFWGAAPSSGHAPGQAQSRLSRDRPGQHATIAIAASDFTDLFGVQLKLNFDRPNSKYGCRCCQAGVQVALGDILSGPELVRFGKHGG